MLKLKHDESVRYFAELEILTCTAYNVLESVLYVSSNRTKYKSHSEYLNYNTRNKSEKVLPEHNLKDFTKNVSYVIVKF